MRVLVGVLALVFAVTLEAQPVVQSCRGDCPEGYKSVCVQRGNDCNCSCVRDVRSGGERLREALEKLGVSASAIEGALRRYVEEVQKASDKFSFEFQDRGQTYAVYGNSWGGRESVIMSRSPH